jgi:hypothetical protein
MDETALYGLRPTHCVVETHGIYLRKSGVDHDGSSIYPKVVPPDCGAANFEG